MAVLPTEDEIQAAKYEDLCRQIADSQSKGQDFVLRTAAQIALYRWKDERRFKRVYSKTRYPYKRDGAIFELSVATAERWKRLLEFASLHGLNPVREAEHYGFDPPIEQKQKKTTVAEGNAQSSVGNGNGKGDHGGQP